MAIYLVSNTGSDSNNGISAPWQTIAKVNSSTFLPGDSVLFECGGVWREQLTFPSSGDASNKIIISSYGDVDLPIIYGSSVMTGFTLVSGTTYLKSSVNTRARICYYNGSKLTLAASSVLNVGQFYWEANVLYINVGENPTGVVEAGQRSKCIYALSKNYLDITEIDARHCNSDWEAAIFAYDNSVGVHDVSVHHCKVKGSSSSGLWAKGSGNITFNNNVVDDVDSLAIKVTSVASGNIVDISSNKVENCVGGISCVDFSNVTLAANELNSILGSGIKVEALVASSLTAVNVNDNIINDTCANVASHAIQIGGTNGKTITGGTISLNKITSTQQLQPVTNYDGYGIDLDYGAINFEVYRNTVVDCDGGGIGVVGNATSNIIFSNIIEDCGINGTNSRAGIICGSNGNKFVKNLVSGCYYGLRIANSVSIGTIDSNIIIGSIAANQFTAVGSTCDCDNNVYFGNDNFSWSGVNYSSFSAYQDASGETLSRFIDPLLSQIAKVLKNNSPCINSGTTIDGVTVDYYGNNAVNPFSKCSIGPYEPWVAFNGTLTQPVAMSSNAIGSVPRVVSFTGNPSTSLIKKMVEFGA